MCWAPASWATCWCSSLSPRCAARITKHLPGGSVEPAAASCSGVRRAVSHLQAIYVLTHHAHAQGYWWVIWLELVPGWALFRGLYEMSQYAFRASYQVRPIRRMPRWLEGTRKRVDSQAAHKQCVEQLSALWVGAALAVAHGWDRRPPRLPAGRPGHHVEQAG